MKPNIMRNGGWVTPQLEKEILEQLLGHLVGQRHKRKTTYRLYITVIRTEKPACPKSNGIYDIKQNILGRPWRLCLLISHRKPILVLLFPIFSYISYHFNYKLVVLSKYQLVCIVLINETPYNAQNSVYYHGTYIRWQLRTGCALMIKIFLFRKKSDLTTLSM